jgi:hypothetical protein
MGKSRWAAELDGAFYRCAGSTLEEIADLSDLQGDQRLVSDFQGAISRTTSVEAPYKYAEVMVRKQLQETGEFDEPVTLISHWKKRRGANATDIFYTALPTRLYYRSLDEVGNHEACILLFPLYGILYGALEKLKPAHPAAVVFQHGRFADILLGDRKRIFYANRRIAFDETPEQLSSLWQMVLSEIESAEKEHHISVEKIVLVTWINSQVEATWPPGIEEKVHYLGEESIYLEGREKKISFLKALADTPASFSVSRSREKICYSCSKLLPLLNIALIVIAICCFAGRLWYGNKNRTLEKVMKAKERALADLSQEQQLTSVPYEGVLGFVRDLSQYRDIPNFKTIVNDVSESLFEGSSLHVLKADYNKGNLKLEVLGEVTVPFDKAFRGYQRFCRTMSQKGYTLISRNFNTSINQSQFVVTLERNGG